ncbi:hypothetical protein C8F04DRAFT_1133154 [Mycena alexandri]|uniref:Uncharacterized protein n=1 Tax=Mycena alexandri TaxID=1745969 RepID=A0AAD6SAW3_9AGAR|nr:hypothetical protein C8F04DRAFT_1133154 [Mycena alexandri]
MASQSVSHSSSDKISSVVSTSSSSSSIAHQTSSQVLAAPLSSPVTTSSVISSSSRRSTSDESSASPSFSSSSSLQIPSSYASKDAHASSPSQTSSYPSTDAQTTPPLSRMPAIIGAIVASVVVVALIAILIFFIYHRGRKRRSKISSIISQQDPFMWEHPLEADVRRKDPAHSAAEPGWPDEFSVSTISTPRPRSSIVSAVSTPLRGRRQSSNALATKGPHYTIRSHASVGDVYGFGQDLAWQEAHYEDVVPMSGPAARPAIGIVPPTPSSETGNHDMPATSLLRNPSTASSVPSVYSTASMTPPHNSVLRTTADIPSPL